MVIVSKRTLSYNNLIWNNLSGKLLLQWSLDVTDSLSDCMFEINLILVVKYLKNYLVNLSLDFIKCQTLWIEWHIQIRDKFIVFIHILIYMFIFYIWNKSNTYCGLLAKFIPLNFWLKIER